ncbi:RpoD family RNA polymerase sigma factor (plasmid) [Leptolyngbya boryana NIES-2135]|jgi:RNA polymerase primary sigma factor|uniref:RpoD family RNA polymerase sigma factor n=1 Tax=Leptolyngbya boryana NIES-2135 TaxID=1973484 RepID=A0A1Z4JT00_LEPBY|nr:MULTISPECIES: sigma-70 family RNA polymerase sigma factor [Leptolyngbya]BAY59773.1 RpoD family RNA polymerase sigma factor [Leptolyngbya boryana NIES-2135]MBD2370574.1 sigma-70 family RNA polymerase sigma factor [Leptolyngbya sp. FACHB-161]MBD2377042.1 sigma-70 family RNA polymerase sigma factor [Leptolyngbya sp. FACHB-238]MBD2401410.1 sigma-70 family RNA polymerase sigma factor [Leptolyngbya sp. FACHB-239]MBD2407961.1 sigma-70 family RNA polymerase sigma factor [Leptolyngbya sp. FACHB-402]
MTPNFSSIRDYLNQMGQYPLLTEDEEQEYGTQIQQMMTILTRKQALVQSLDREPTLNELSQALQISTTEIQAILRKGNRAKSKMIQHNLRLVVSVIKKRRLHYSTEDFLDLMQAGRIGLDRAAEKFDPKLGYKFSTYAVWWVRQFIAREVMDNGRSVRIPVHLYEKWHRMHKVHRQLTIRLSRSPTREELAAELEVSIEQLTKLQETFQSIDSLDRPINSDSDDPLINFIDEQIDTSAYETPIESVDRMLLRDSIEQALEGLTQKQQTVIRLRLGLDSDPMTLEQIGQILNLTRERIRQIEAKAKKILQRNPNLQQYFLNK